MFCYFTGPVSASVVGQKVPIYTIFGKTIDRLKMVLTSTPADKILLTRHTKQILSKEQNPFLIEAAGPLLVKVLRNISA